MFAYLCSLQPALFMAHRSLSPSASPIRRSPSIHTGLPSCSSNASFLPILFHTAFDLLLCVISTPLELTHSERLAKSIIRRRILFHLQSEHHSAWHRRLLSSAMI